MKHDVCHINFIDVEDLLSSSKHKSSHSNNYVLLHNVTNRLGIKFVPQVNRLLQDDNADIDWKCILIEADDTPISSLYIAQNDLPRFLEGIDPQSIPRRNRHVLEALKQCSVSSSPANKVTLTTTRLGPNPLRDILEAIGFDDNFIEHMFRKSPQ